MSETAVAIPKKVEEDTQQVDALQAVMEATVQRGTGRQTIHVPFPEDLAQMTPLQRAIILQSTPQWSSHSLEFIMFTDLWARQRGLDIFGGNVYVVDGKPNTSDEAKIGYAMRSGKVEYMFVDDIVKGTNPLTGANDFYAASHLKLKNEPNERVYKAWLSEWKNPKNANWQKNPTDSLQRKSLARNCNFAVPMGTEGDDFAEAPTDSNGTPLTAAVNEQIEKSSTT